MRPYRENESRITPENNHQILTVFFIVASLLGVFFTLGYIVGRNSPFLLGPAIASAHEIEVKPTPPAPKPLPVVAAQPVVAQEAPKPVPKKVVVVAPPPVPKPEPAPQAEPVGDHPTGTYLQLVATNREGVDEIVGALREKGFKAVAAEIPEKRGWFRALVGPLADASIPGTRTELKTAGFAGESAIKRSF